MRRAFAPLLAVLLGAALVAGCGDGERDGSEPTERVEGGIGPGDAIDVLELRAQTPPESTGVEISFLEATRFETELRVTVRVALDDGLYFIDIPTAIDGFSNRVPGEVVAEGPDGERAYAFPSGEEGWGQRADVSLGIVTNTPLDELPKIEFDLDAWVGSHGFPGEDETITGPVDASFIVATNGAASPRELRISRSILQPGEVEYQFNYRRDEGPGPPEGRLLLSSPDVPGLHTNGGSGLGPNEATYSFRLPNGADGGIVTLHELRGGRIVEQRAVMLLEPEGGVRPTPTPHPETVETLDGFSLDDGDDVDGPVHVTFVDGSRSVTETRATVQIDLPEGVALAALGRLVPSQERTGPYAPVDVHREDLQHTYTFKTPGQHLGQDMYLEIGPFVRAEADSASIEVDVAAWLERTGIDPETGGEAEVLPQEILSADSEIGELRIISIEPFRALSGGARFYFAGDIEGTWVAGSDAGVAAALRGVHDARNPGELVERGDLAVVVQPVWSIEQLRGTVTLTRWDSDALVQEAVGILLRPVAEE